MHHVVLAGFWDQAGPFGLPIGVVAFGMWMLLMNDKSRNASQAQKPAIQLQPSVKPAPQVTAAPNTKIKLCDVFLHEVPIFDFECPECGGTTFTHNANPEIVKAPTEQQATQEVVPEFKDCPMCAEQIKYAAIKCRFCMSDL